MKFVCSSKTFTEAFNNAALAVDCRSMQPTMKNILLSCYCNEVILTGYDLELSIMKVFEARTEENGKLLLDYEKYSAFFNNYTPVDERLHMEVNEKNEVIIETTKKYKCSKSEGRDAVFPAIPVASVDNRFHISNRKLRYILSWITRNAFENTDRMPIVSGAMFKLYENTLNITAVDGCYTVCAKESVEYDGEELIFAVPRKTILAMNKILNDTDILEPVKVSIGGGLVTFEVDGYTVTSPGANTKVYLNIIKELNSLKEVNVYENHNS